MRDLCDVISAKICFFGCDVWRRQLVAVDTVTMHFGVCQLSVKFECFVIFAKCSILSLGWRQLVKFSTATTNPVQLFRETYITLCRR